MKKSYKLENLGCANCARKMEEGINALANVNSAKVVFMTEKLVLDVVDGTMDSVLDEAQSIISRYEDDCVIVR